jgi:hypothetical protein
MIVNAAVFTCSICGEASSNICAYCTKDACSNHRCERCKRCSDCCECEVPLSAEEAVVVEAEAATLPVHEPEEIVPEADVLEPASPPEPVAETRFPVFLTAAESSVFVAGSVFSEPLETTNPDEPIDPDEFTERDPAEPHE